MGSIGLCSGFPIELIALVLQHLPELTSVEKVKAILPVLSKEMAEDFTLLSRNTFQGEIPYERSRDTCQKFKLSQI